MKGKAVYDFDSRGPDELTIRVDDILTILDDTVGNGWYKAQNTSGQEGYVPSDFVKLNAEMASQIANQLENPTGHSSGTSGGWSQGEFSESDTDEEWDEKPRQPISTCGTASPVRIGGSSSPIIGGTMSRSNAPRSESPNMMSIATRRIAQISGDTLTNFVKGVYTTEPAPPYSEIVQINISDDSSSIEWRPKGPEMALYVLPKHSVGSKCAGLKKYVQYHFAERDGGQEVIHRYKQFDWLVKLLKEKYPVLTIPPLPERQLTGRFDDDLIELRKRGLQIWLNYMSRHPILCYSGPFQHFIGCTDKQQKKWKQGKRDGENDMWQGGKWLMCIELPNKSIQHINDRVGVIQFGNYKEALLSAVGHMIDSQYALSKSSSGTEASKKDYEKVSSSFKELSLAFGKASTSGLHSLSNSTAQAALAFDQISKLFGGQSNKDSVPFLQALCDHKGLLGTGLPNMLGIAHTASAAVADVEKQAQEYTASPEDVNQSRDRQRVINFALLAEQTHLSRHQEVEFNDMIAQYIQAQIEFYKKITGKLEETLRLFPFSQ